MWPHGSGLGVKRHQQLGRLMAVVVVCALGLVGWTGARDAFASGATSGAVHASLSDRPMSHLGVFEPGSPASYTPVEGFERAAGRKPNILMYYLGWRTFHISYANAAWKHGATLLVDLDPTNVSVASIAGGGQNSHLRALATTVRTFRHPVIISFGHEMNGGWYSWGWKHTNPKTFVRAWRHIVQLFRNVGADNVTWLWTINAVGGNEGPIRDWWPGAKYVTWVGIDGYIYKRTSTFASEFGASIKAVRKLTHRPIFICETAVGQVAEQPRKIPGLFAGARKAHLLGLLWFDKDEQSKAHPSILKQDWRLEGHTAAIKAFRAAVRKYMG